MGFIDDVINWFGDAFKPLFDFFYTYRSHPLLWIGILVIGLLISKLTYDALNKNNSFCI